jgi:hypothetical protein
MIECYLEGKLLEFLEGCFYFVMDLLLVSLIFLLRNSLYSCEEGKC